MRYEELLASPGAVLKGICDFIELPYDPTMEQYHEFAGERLSAEIQDQHDAAGKLLATKAQREAIFEHTRRPPDPERAGRWRMEMDADERARFESVAGGLLQELGYAMV